MKILLPQSQGTLAAFPQVNLCRFVIYCSSLYLKYLYYDRVNIFKLPCTWMPLF